MLKTNSFIHWAYAALMISIFIVPSDALADGKADFPADPSVNFRQEFTGYRQEAALLNLQLGLDGIRIIDRAKNYPYKKGPEKITILHIWAIECSPSMDGLPSILQLAQEWSRSKQVRIIAMSETMDESRVKEFWTRASRESVAKISLAISEDSRIRDAMQTGVQPLTLLLDQDLSNTPGVCWIIEKSQF